MKGEAKSFGVQLLEHPAPLAPNVPGPDDEYDWIRAATPFAKFTFRYRSHNDLIKSGIIKSDIPEGDIEGMTAEQLRAVVRTMKAENAITREALRKVKRERKEQAPVNPVKRERGPPEVIDLTDD